MIQLLKKFRIYLIPLAAVICIVFPSHLTIALPYMIGGSMVIVGFVYEWNAIRKKEYKTLETAETAQALILLIMGTFIILKHENSIGILGYTWGGFGLMKGTKELNIAFYKLSVHLKFGIELIQAIVTIGLALILISDPFEKFTHHVMFLGFEMLATTLKIYHEEYIAVPERNFEDNE
ncbi:DUF308 domain-containing protein [Velocimicrobium porci]|uniref:DUF308 domain-containing protein n=1 Tax=Velocimicrobium porci TaxID=2606634 RepID=A0A6L5XZT6_9FIRM|nr:DUF308 domain-containing protein [Velocimicrobium porci]MSS63981.1 hypothetical protein [Velocimicrobium porci]